MDPRTALAVYRASCQTSAQRIKHFLAGREGFALAYNDAEELDGLNGWRLVIQSIQKGRWVRLA